jgi:hypothetical protein
MESAKKSLQLIDPDVEIGERKTSESAGDALTKTRDRSHEKIALSKVTPQFTEETQIRKNGFHSCQTTAVPG